ncbi:MAG: hypothetical protein WAM14_25385 [Candidatus Nitrosopolaris sp.]
MNKSFQNQLLNFLESGRIKVDQQRRRYNFEIKDAKVFAAANDINRLSKPLQSRFRRLHLPPYTEERFLEVAVKVLPKLKETTACMVGTQVWGTSKDVRDVISIAKLIRRNDTEEDVKQIIRTMAKYGDKI